jgi:2-polyprenyl-3-methyl-5-hydroxy-6-metoxy-1,4-benzoquinol methylase
MTASAPLRCSCCRSRRVRRSYRLRAFDVWFCGECGAGFRDPQPGAAEVVAMYEDERYHASPYFIDGRGQARESPEISIYRRALGDLVRLAPSTDASHGEERGVHRGRLLDVGSGSGVFLDLARMHGFRVSGVEISSRHVAEARRRFDPDVWQGDFLAAPHAPSSFEVVTMWDFLEHVADPAAALAWAHRLLVPGGVLLVFTIDSDSLFNLAGDVLHRLAGRRATTVLELLYDARHNHYFTRPALSRLLGEQGFRIEAWRADRAHLGRWLSEPAPRLVVGGGVLVDWLSFLVGRSYRCTALCRRVAAPAG